MMNFDYSIYQINEEILGCFDPDTGELIDEETLTRLMNERDDVIRQMLNHQRNIQAHIENLTAERDTFNALIDAAKNRLVHIREAIENALGGEKYSDGRVSVYYQPSKTVIIDDEKALAPEFTRIKTEPDKQAIKAALGAGFGVSGAHLDEKPSMVIRWNKGGAKQ